jgi:tRNA (cmo5U34)-methyltransferase
MSKSGQDQIYASHQPVKDFVFDDKVAAVFTDMINRSVPGYATIISMIGTLAERYCTPGSNIYDLGCSLGGATMAMSHQISHQDYTLYAIDNSDAMIRRFRAALDATPSAAQLPLQLICADIDEIEMTNASVVVLNFTLQFIDRQKRDALMEKICRSLRPGGILVLSEKIVFPEPELNALFIDMYHQFKQAQGYSELEVSQKRAALENVLIPESIDAHKERLMQAGFRSCDVWFQCFNFASMVAFK